MPDEGQREWVSQSTQLHAIRPTKKKTNSNSAFNNCSTKYAFPKTLRNPPRALLYFIINKQRCCSFESNPELLTLLFSKSSETAILITLSMMLRLSFSSRLKCQLLAKVPLKKRKCFFHSKWLWYPAIITLFLKTDSLLQRDMTPNSSAGGVPLDFPSVQSDICKLTTPGRRR